MSNRLVGTGVVLRRPQRQAWEAAQPQAVDPASGELMVEIQIFAELEASGRKGRIGGSTDRAAISATEDPTKRLVDLAEEARELHLGPLLGDLRIAGCDLTRFEFYSAPFRIELAADLRSALVGLWD